MKFKSFFSAFVAFLTIPLVAFAANGTMKGSGTAASPFQIEDYEDLKAIGKGAYLYSLNYVLTKDIDASASKTEMCNEDGCNGFIPIGKKKDAADSTVFWGTIDGQNHTISHLNIWLPCENDVGFIYILIGTVKNLYFDHLNVTGGSNESNHVGGVAARSVGTVENVHVTNGFVQGKNRIGGIVGAAMKMIGYSNMTPIIENVSFHGDIKGHSCIGGIVGETDDAAIDSAIADVNIVVLGERAGGIVGYGDGYITNSLSNGTIRPASDEVDEVGGIAGRAEGWIKMCVSTMDLLHSGPYYLNENIGGIVGNGSSVDLSYALGSVEGTQYVGGIAGQGLAKHSYVMGTVRGRSYVGGLVGYGSARYSYAANVVQGDSFVGGAVGSIKDAIISSYWNTEISGLDTSAGGTGLTTAQMMKWESFVGWDTLGYDEYVNDGTDTCSYYEYLGACYSAGSFIRYWGIDEGKSFPYLNDHPLSKKSLIPIAAPTSAAKWQETPKVASLIDVEGELVGEWLGWMRTNDDRDTLYYGYRIGVVNESDTLWGSSSYMAVPNRIEISTIAELQKIGNHIAYPLVATYELTQDIDASGFDFKPIGDSVHVFSGVFDGKNHTIENLTIVDPNRDFAGMFGFVDRAIIKDIVFKNAKVVGSWYIGVLAGEIDLSLVTNVVSLNGNVSGTSFIGGLMGATRASEIHVVGTTGYVTANDIVGGIFGASASKIVDAFSMNVIKGYENVGGIMGLSDKFSSGTLQQNIYSASILKAPNPQGIIGGSFYGSGENMESCYFDSTVTGNVRGGNTTEEMLKQSTYEGFGFDSVWAIQEGVSYPYFKGMDPVLPGKLVDDGTVNMLAGFGTERNPYKIRSYDELKYVGKYEYGLDKHYKLVGNINATFSLREDCNADSSLCKGFEPIGEFSGVFDGANKIIAGLSINRPDEDSVGLFRALASGAKVTGIVFNTASHFGESYSYSSDRTKGVTRGKNYVGVLAGVDNGAELERIYVKDKVLGENYVGGIVGKKTAGSISLSASRDTVSGNDYVGGLVGGLVTSSTNSVTDCFSVATVLGEKDVGGLFGYSNTAYVTNSFGAGNVEGTSKFGGIVGEDVQSTYTSVYYDSTLWLTKTTAGGELRNTNQMVQKENYKNWDFETTWRISSDTTYPYFAWICTSYYLSTAMDERIRPNRNIDATMMHMAGSGTDDDPFLIKTYGDLKSIGFGKYKLSAVYKLANDIDASVSAIKPIGEIEYFGYYFGDYGIQDTEPFSGKFDGNGFSIENIHVYIGGSEPLGFIDTLAPSGLIENLTLKNSKARVVGTNYGEIKNIRVEGNLNSMYETAGIVHYNTGSVENCTVKVQLNGSTPFAGIAYANNGKIVNAAVDVSGKTGTFAGIALVNGGFVDNATVTAKVIAENGAMAGIVGLNRKTGHISASSAIVDMVNQNGGSGYVSYYEALYQGVSIEFHGVGGLVAVDSGSVVGSTASGVIDASKSANVGGLIGLAYGKKIDSLHAAVDVTGYNNVGGLVGQTNTSIANSYALGNVKGTYIVGGFAGVIDSLGVVEKSFASGDVEGGDVEGGAGFVGQNRGTIRRSYSAGDVWGEAIFALRNQSVIEDCYASGDLHAVWNYPIATGFVFKNDYGSVARAYSSGTIIWDDNRKCGGMPMYADSTQEFYYIVNNCEDSLMQGKGLTPSEMRKQDSFAGFDFDSVWYIKEGVSYPMLRGLPNVPFAGNVELALYEDEVQATAVREKLLDKTFVMDTTATTVIRLDSSSEALLDSLEKMDKNAKGDFTVSYRVGMLFDGDTIWSSPAQASFTVDRTPLIVVRNHEVHFSASLSGNHIALRFGLQATDMVNFSMLDMQGRVVRSLDLGPRDVGDYFETLDVEGIARGRYVGVLQVNGKVAEKALLLKR